jgi:transposase
MNWQRGRSYGQDLRDKMFAAIDRGINPGAVAMAFAVSVSWIYKALARRRETGETAPRRQCCHVAGKLDAYHEAIRTRVAAVPDMTIGELRAWMLATYSVSVGHAVMWETLRRLELTLKKRPGTPPSRRARTSRRRARSGALGSPA